MSSARIKIILGLLAQAPWQKEVSKKTLINFILMNEFKYLNNKYLIETKTLRI